MMNNVFDYALTVFQLDLSKGKLADFSECLAESCFIHGRVTEDELERYRAMLAQSCPQLEHGPNLADGTEHATSGP